MAKVCSPPEGFAPPGFDEAFMEGRYDMQLDDRLHKEYFERLKAECLTRHQGEYVGEVVYFPQGDGAAAYMVLSHKPFSLLHLPIHDAWRLPEAHERGLRLADVKAQVDFERHLAAKRAEGDAWWDSQVVGSILHYHNGFGEFVRCEVVDGPYSTLSGSHDGKHLQPIALVGNWGGYELSPTSFHGKKVVERSGGWRPAVSNIYEHPDFARRDVSDPRGMEPLEIGEA